MVSVNPGTLATPVHNIAASTRVTVNLSGGWPFTRIVSCAAIANGPSILPITMTSPGHSAGFVHTAHTSSALAEEWDDPPNGPFASPMSVIFPRFALPLCKTGRPELTPNTRSTFWRRDADSSCEQATQLPAPGLRLPRCLGN